MDLKKKNINAGIEKEIEQKVILQNPSYVFLLDSPKST